jgi:hypothetical protein
VAPREEIELAGDDRRVESRTLDLGQVLGILRTGLGVSEHQIGERGDGRETVVEVVRDSARELPDDLVSLSPQDARFPLDLGGRGPSDDDEASRLAHGDHGREDSPLWVARGTRRSQEQGIRRAGVGRERFAQAFRVRAHQEVCEIGSRDETHPQHSCRRRVRILDDEVTADDQNRDRVGGGERMGKSRREIDIGEISGVGRHSQTPAGKIGTRSGRGAKKVMKL